MNKCKGGYKMRCQKVELSTLIYLKEYIFDIYFDRLQNIGGHCMYHNLNTHVYVM
jgi:hypothetical protein